MAPHSSTLAWKIPWMEEPGRLQSMGSWRVWHWATSLSLSCIGEGNGNPLQCSSLENPRDRGAWWAAVYGVAQSRTRLKRLQQQQQHSWFITLVTFCCTVKWMSYMYAEIQKRGMYEGLFLCLSPPPGMIITSRVKISLDVFLYPQGPAWTWTWSCSVVSNSLRPHGL